MMGACFWRRDGRGKEKSPSAMTNKVSSGSKLGLQGREGGTWERDAIGLP